MAGVGVCLRLDDYDSHTPPHVIAALAEIFQRQQVNCLFGVIPFRPSDENGGRTSPMPLSSAAKERLRDLVEQGLVIPALHGYAHTRGQQGQPEFEHGSESAQLEKLSQGKALLEAAVGRPISAFVPPWNGVSRATEPALSAAGIAYISTSIEMGETGRWSLPDIPSTSFWNNRQAIADAQANREQEPLVVLTGHFYDFHDTAGRLDQRRLEQFDEMLTWVGQQDGVQWITFDEAYRRATESGATWRNVQRCRFAWDMPHRLRMSLVWPRWLPTRRISRPLNRIRLIGLGVWVAVVLLAGCLAFAISLLLPEARTGPVRAVIAVVAVAWLMAGAWYPFNKQLVRAAALAIGGGLFGLAANPW